MPGYFRAYSETVRQASHDLEDREFRVYMTLLSFANCEGMCWPGIARLVSETGHNTTAIYAALDALVALKYIITVRTGTRDPLTRQQLPNVYKIIGAVIDDDCADDEYQADEPIPFASSEKESKHHQGTQPLNTTKEKQPETPPTTQQISSNEGEGKGKSQRKSGKEKTPTRSVIPNSPPQVPPAPSQKYYTGPLDEWADPLPQEQEQTALQLQARTEQKLALREARRLVDKFGQANVDWAIAHMAKQSNIYNPPGYVRSLLERRAVEQADAQPVNPGDAYVTGALKDYIIH